MVQITFIQPDGARQTVTGTAGQSVMETAQQHGITGVIAECGGSMACATCHAFFDPASMARIGAPSPSEDDMLDFAATPRTDCSRLTCQVTLTAALEGAEITIPETQV